MKLDNLYPTTTIQYTVEYTDFITNLTYLDSETMAAPYYMGYINWDDVPSILHMSKFNVVSGVEEAYVEFLDVTQAENVPWFFTGRYSTSPISAYGTYIVNDSDKYISPSVGGGGAYGFFNSLEIQRVGTTGTYSLYVFYNIINPATTPPTYSKAEGYLLYNNSQQISISDFWKWINSEIVLYISVTINGVQENIEFSFDDFASGYCEKEHTNGSIQFYLTDYSTPYSSRDVQPNNTLAGYSNLSVGTLLHAEIDDTEKPYIINNFAWHTGYSNEKYIRIDYAQTLSHYVGGYNGHLMGGFNGRIPYTFFAYSTTDRFYVFGNMVVWKYTSSQTRVARIFTSDEIAKIYSAFFTRIMIGVPITYGYSDSIAYPLFNDDNSPKWEYVTGNLETIQQQLQQWQYTNIIENDFTESDIPEYTPPEPGSDEESGDKIDFIMRSFSGASNFITNYVMTRHQVGIFGNRLWTSWVDSLGNPTEMIKNIRIFYTGGDTGSIDIGSVMPFIVSMKIFPFDLSNFIGYETDGIKIGTGHYPINVPGCWYLPRSSVYVSCGTVTIPRIFNDFRDYENMNIMCYVPYCGTVELNPGDVIGRTLSCTYGVDLQSGGCTAYIIVDNNYPVATISGQMGSSVPLTATNSGQLMSQRLSDISGASALIGNTTMQVQRESERPHPKQANMDSAIVGAVLQAADSVPQRFRRSAISCPTMSAGNGLDAFAQPPTPYIQMRYGIYDLPANYKHSIGRISTKSNKLSEYKDTGFITCSNVDTSPLTCHNDEKAAIKAALESGVYI